MNPFPIIISVKDTFIIGRKTFNSRYTFDYAIAHVIHLPWLIMYHNLPTSFFGIFRIKNNASLVMKTHTASQIYVYRCDLIATRR